MSRNFKSTALGAAAFAVSLAGAQGLAPAPAPTTPPASEIPYSSAFDGYRPFAAGEVGDWRRANETVREIGGWRAYAREIQRASQPPAAASPAQPPASAAQPHQGHQR